MSRIGKLPISIPAGVTVNYDEASHVCTVKENRFLVFRQVRVVGKRNTF